MKKIFLTLLVTGLITTPTFALCHINGPCTADASNTSSVKNQYKQQNLDFKNQSRKTIVPDSNYQERSYNSTFINSENLNYDANCQFGVCLPKAEQMQKNRGK